MLLVDDNTDVRQVLTALLRTIPGVVILGEASDGRFAVTLVREVTPDVVLMDINMPVMTGIDATRSIHADCPGVRVIGLAIEQPAQRVQSNAGRGSRRVCLQG